MRLPKRIYPADTPFKVEWNLMVDALASLQPVDGPGMQTHKTPFGTSRQADVRRGVAMAGGIDVSLCDPATGEVKLYTLYGVEVG